MLYFFNGMLRVAGLLLKFILSLYLIKIFSLHDVGVFSLLSAAASMTPGIVGFGLSYFVNREIVIAERSRVIILSRNRLIFSVAAATLASIAIYSWNSGSKLIGDFECVLFCAILIIEVFGFDLTLILIARGKSIHANFLLFVRSSFWIAPFIIASFFVIAFRNIEHLVIFWLSNQILFMIAIMTIFKRDIFSTRMLAKDFSITLGNRRYTSLLPIWISDVSLSFGIYIDRFIISGVLGLEKAGIYFFFSSMANAIVTICQSSTVQVFMPRLRKQFLENGFSSLPPIVYRLVAVTLSTSVILSVLTYAASIPVVYYIGKNEVSAYYHIFPIILAYASFKILFDLFGTIEYATAKDRTFFAFNIFSLAVSSAITLAMTVMFGLIGAAFSIVLSYVLLAALRFSLWHFRTRLARMSKSQ